MQNIETSSEPKTKLNMNMQMRLLKMFVKHSWRHCEKKFLDSMDVKKCQEWFWWFKELVKNVKKKTFFFYFIDKNSYKNAEY